jgi:hypothetical protein
MSADYTDFSPAGKCAARSSILRCQTAGPRAANGDRPDGG